MRPKLLSTAIETYHDLNENVLVLGPPGCGKTEITGQTAERLGIGFMHIHCPMKQPEDMGFPVVTRTKSLIEGEEEHVSVRFVIPSEMPVVGNPNFPEFGILLLDEIGGCDNSQQKVFSNIVQARELHGHKLKPGWSIVGTANRAKDRAGSNRLLTILADRFIQIELEPSLDDTCNYLLSVGADPVVPAFLRFKPDSMYDFDPNRDRNSTCRGWAKVARILYKVPHVLLYESILGIVGDGRAPMFMSFFEMYLKLPVPEMVILQAETYPIPPEVSVKWALCGALAQRATKDNFDQIITYARRLPKEFQTILIIDSVAKNPAVQQTKGFISWAANEGASIIL